MHRNRLSAFFASIGGLLVIAAMGALLLDEVEVSKELKSTYALADEEIRLMRHGDIIMRRGYGMVSRMIAAQLEGKYNVSHCGVVIERNHRFYVIHTVSSSVSEIDGVQINTLADFVKQSKPGSVIVNRLQSPQAANSLAESVIGFLREEVPFDHHFNIEDSTAFYCSELIWRGLKERANIDLFEGLYETDHGWYSFDVFFNPELFETVINHHQ
jgi:uncharacterized protein YycO